MYPLNHEPLDLSQVLTILGLSESCPKALLSWVGHSRCLGTQLSEQNASYDPERARILSRQALQHAGTFRNGSRTFTTWTRLPYFLLPDPYTNRGYASRYYMSGSGCNHTTTSACFHGEALRCGCVGMTAPEINRYRFRTASPWWGLWCGLEGGF